MYNNDWYRILKIKVFIIKKIIKKVIDNLKNDILLLLSIVLACVFFIYAIIAINHNSFLWLIEIKGYLITSFIMLKIYCILCSIFKTKVCLSNLEESYIFSLFSNEIMIKYKCLTVILKDIITNVVLIGLYYYITYDRVYFLGVVFLVVFSIFSELLNSYLYQNNRFIKIMRIIYSISIIMFLGVILLICSNIVSYKYFNIYLYFNNSYVLGTLLFIIILASIIIYRKIILSNNKEALLFYGDINLRLNNICKKFLQGIDVSLDAQIISNSIYQKKKINLSNNFYKLGYRCIIFKNLSHILSINIVQRFYSYFDVIVVSILIFYFKNTNIILLLFFFLITLISTKTNAFFIDDIKNREINKCLPFYPVEFLKGYLVIPLILTFLSSVYFIFLLNLKCNFDLSTNLLILMVLISLFIGETILKQCISICNILKIKNHINGYMEMGISFFVLYEIFYGTVYGIILSLCLVILEIIVCLISYNKRMKIYILDE